MAVREFSLSKNFALRGESYKAGMLLLINHFTETDWKLGNKFPARLSLISKNIEILYKNYEIALKNEKIPSFERVNSHFKKLISSYILILEQHTTLKDSFQALREAEYCAVWKKGRKYIDTQFSIDNPEYRGSESLKIVLSETPYNDSDLFKQEYVVSKTWSEWLPQWQQDFIRENGGELSKKSIPSSLRSVAGLANVSRHECKINDISVVSYFRHATQLPIDLLGKKGAEDEQFRLTCLNVASQIRLSLDEKFRHLDITNREELVILSQSLVSPLMNVARINDTKIYEFKEKAIQLFQYAFANPKAKINDDGIKALFFTKEELERKKHFCYKDFLVKWGLTVQEDKIQYKQYKPIKITLLSTNHPINALRHFGAYSLQLKQNKNNTALLLGAIARYLESSFLVSPKIDGKERFPQLEEYINKSSIVDCFNIQLDKLIKILKLCEKRKEVSRNCKKILVSIIESVLNNADIKKSLDESQNTFQLLHALHSLLSIPNGQGVLANDERHKPQLRSTAEIMIMNCLKGIAWVACKSGKDRTGGECISSDAAAIYYHRNKQFPCYDDGQVHRGSYLKILHKLYNSGHHQKVASENAPGAEGLVKPTYFFPKDLQLDTDIQLETQLARLNKPKAATNSSKGFFNNEILNEDLQDIKNKVFSTKLNTSTLADWKRNLDIYFIKGKSIRELLNKDNFENEKELSEFIKAHLLDQVENEELKDYYQALILYSFNHGGFPHAFSKISGDLINKYYERHNQTTIIGQPDVCINFTWSKECKGIQIEEVNTFKEKKDLNEDEIMMPEKEEYYCQTHSCILLKLNEVKNESYKLSVNILSANVDCIDVLKPIFFKESSFLQAFIFYLESLLDVVKNYFDKLNKSGPLNKDWLSKTNSAFFSKSPVSMGDKEQQRQRLKEDVALHRFSNSK